MNSTTTFCRIEREFAMTMNVEAEWVWEKPEVVDGLGTRPGYWHIVSLYATTGNGRSAEMTAEEVDRALELTKPQYTP